MNPRVYSIARLVATLSFEEVVTRLQVNDPIQFLRLSRPIFERASDRAFSDADPYKLIEIDPQAVKTVWNPTEGRRPYHGEVIGGDWESQSSPIDEEIVFRTVWNHIRHDEPLAVEEYRRYYFHHHHVHEQRGWARTFEGRCRQVSKLIQRMREEGYLTQRELLAEEDFPRLQDLNNDSIHPLLNEIRVHIGRNGKFHFWRCGSHRLAIAQALELSSVPALVGIRHEQWQETRDRIRAGLASSKAQTLAHPQFDHADLQEYELAPPRWQLTDLEPPIADRNEPSPR